jgi:poly(3-hydroxybutyrate) depolymerase
MLQSCHLRESPMPPLARLFAGALQLFVALLPLAARGWEPLPALNIDIRETSVSGISSGGYMAVQFQVAHSGIVKGAGVVAAGPWYCARNDVARAIRKCSCTADASHRDCEVSETSAEVPLLVEATRQAAATGAIDDPANLARHRVLTLAGGRDATVPPAVVRQLGDYYLRLALPPQNLSPLVLPEAGHTLPTPDYGGACSVSESPYLADCDFDAAGAVLQWIHGPLAPRRHGPPQGRFLRFDQRAYTPSAGFFDFLWSSGMDSSGWLYVPPACAQGQPCRLHVALHGCKQGQSFLTFWSAPGAGLYYGTTFVMNAGYDDWADTNNLVILYPQAVSIPFLNPNGCWDWWGYTGARYADRGGVQIAALRAMVERLAAGRRP